MGPRHHLYLLWWLNLKKLKRPGRFYIHLLPDHPKGILRLSYKTTAAVDYSITCFPYSTTYVSKRVFHNVCSTTCISQRVFHKVNSTTCIPQRVFHNVYPTACIAQRAFHNMYSTTCIPQRASHSVHSTTCIPQRVSHNAYSTACIPQRVFHNYKTTTRTVCVYVFPVFAHRLYDVLELRLCPRGQEVDAASRLLPKAILFLFPRPPTATGKKKLKHTYHINLDFHKLPAKKEHFFFFITCCGGGVSYYYQYEISPKSIFTYIYFFNSLLQESC